MAACTTRTALGRAGLGDLPRTLAFFAALLLHGIPGEGQGEVSLAGGTLVQMREGPPSAPGTAGAGRSGSTPTRQGRRREGQGEREREREKGEACNAYTWSALLFHPLSSEGLPEEGLTRDSEHFTYQTQHTITLHKVHPRAPTINTHTRKG